MPDLAVVIPAYKAAYFEAALQSLASQRNKNFNVYVGDDGSPDDLKGICDRFAGTLPISYTRFDQNIGAKNLVHQWTRTIALSNEEKWIWLFSDDDVADTECVSSFYTTLDQTAGQFDVYRFNTVVIDKYGKLMTETPQGPLVESSLQMAYNILLSKRGNSMPDHIFSRDIYKEAKGFVFTDYAQSADWATSILFSHKKGMCIIPEAKLNWRMSGSNISSIARDKKAGMFKGYLQFLQWLLVHFQYLKNKPAEISFEEMKRAALQNMMSVVVSHYKGLSASTIVPAFRFLRTTFNLSLFQALKIMVLMIKRSSPLLSKISFQLKHLAARRRAASNL